MRQRATVATVIVLVALVLSAAAEPTRSTHIDPLLSGNAAAQIVISGRDVLVLDAGPPDLFRERRIRGARHADYGLWLDRTGRDPRDDATRDAWAADLRDEGVWPETEIVIYGRPGSYSAPATTWYGFRMAGVRNVSVVDGGFEAVAAHLPDEWIDRRRIESADAEPTDRAPADRPPVAINGPPPLSDHWTGPMGAPAMPVATVADIRDALRDGRTRFIDTRRRREFVGEETRGNPRPGRIPGAVHLDHRRVVAEDGTVLDRDAVRALMAELGIAPDDPVILYCQSGGRSAAVTLALLRAGWTDVRNSFDSFRGWSADESCPIELHPPAE